VAISLAGGQRDSVDGAASHAGQSAERVVHVGHHGLTLPRVRRILGESPHLFGERRVPPAPAPGPD
jgi:hypothetical protein